MKANPHIQSMSPYTLAELSVPDGKKPMILAQNESFLPPSPHVLTAIKNTLESIQLYPDTNWTELVNQISELHSIPSSQILCGSGSMELIGYLAQCFAGPGDQVLSSQYGYAYFRTATLASGADYVQAPEVDFTVNIDAMIEAVCEQTKIIFIANPGNPTGTRISREELLRLRESIDDEILLVIDEAYGEFPDFELRSDNSDSENESTFDFVERGNTVILRTFSKAYGLAGQRIGWGLFPDSVSSQMRKVLNPGNVSIAGQVAAVAAIKDQDYMHRTCAATIQIRDQFIIDLRKLGLIVPRSFTNFVLIQFANDNTAKQIFDGLRNEGIMMRPMASFGLPNCLRATISHQADMDKTLDILNGLLDGLTDGGLTKEAES